MLHNQQLYDQQTRLDIDRERVIDELSLTKGNLEQLRNEAANVQKIFRGSVVTLL
ncbi:hypothetical protein J3R83DRAFT_7517 [Lanmaoa asiatica]|nr:hypothetical protein J3R83DRAFT_7474 [Lanmaoa asiatica]KAH0826031.1 hypothetical protein J3R83DRAFT_7517 [Lanmaoa asiatica]